MNTNEPGISTDALLDRRHLLEANLEKVMDAMKSSGLADPVGLIVDVNDHHGRQCAIYFYRGEELSGEEATQKVDRQIAEWRQKRMIPTLIVVTTLSGARYILPNTSPTALQSLADWEAQRQPGQHLVVVVASKGNSYATVELGLARTG